MPDDLLFALAEYLFSLEPPPNPNAGDPRAAAGRDSLSEGRLRELPHAAALHQQQADAGSGLSSRRPIIRIVPT